MTETTANYDETWKEAITIYFEDFLKFFYHNIHQQINWEKPPISLEKELQQITASAKTEKRHADKLFKVWLLNDQELWLLIHIEVQSQYDKEFPMRIFIYNYRAFDLYHQPVISLAILGDDNQKWRPDSYQYGIGSSQVKIEFSIVKLLDFQWEELEASNNIFAKVVMAHLKTKATSKNFAERKEWKWQLIRSLYEEGLTKFDIINLGKFIDKMMSLPPSLQQKFKEQVNQFEQERKMPFLSTIEEMALERGQEIGQEKGAKEARQQDIFDLLETRFNTLPESLVKSLNKIDDLALLKELLIETIKVNSLEEFEALINQNSNNQN